MFSYIKKFIFYGIVLFLPGFYSLSIADEDRHLAVDREIAGTESHIGAPKGTPNRIVDTHKTIGSSQGTRKAGPSSVQQPVSAGENHGNIYTNTGQINNPIFETDINVNPESGTVETGITVDTSGELEDKQILDADLQAQDVTSVDAEIESGSTTGGTPESSGSSSNPIVGTEAYVNPESGTVEADATVDTSGELEEKQILDADVTAGETTSAETEVGSATDITQSDTVQSADITTQPVSTVPATSDLTAEVDTTGATTGGEADVGVEADVSGTSEGEDVACDPADGLTSSAVCSDLKL